MDWRDFPMLRQRRAIPAPGIDPLPPLSEINLSPAQNFPYSQRVTEWPRFPIDPDNLN
jgi:hypothetical protein